MCLITMWLTVTMLYRKIERERRVWMCVHIFSPEFIEGGILIKDVYLLCIYNKKANFFFGKMPSESNHENEPAFKELYSLQTRSTLLEKTIAYWLIPARCVSFSQSRWALRFFSLDPLLLSAQPPLSVTVGWEACPESTTRRIALNERWKWKWMMIYWILLGFFASLFASDTSTLLNP